MGVQEHIRAIYDTLLESYGHQGWWPIIVSESGDSAVPANDFQRLEICAGAILTQNTNWNNVATALKSLSSHNLLSVEKLLEAEDKEIAFAIKSAGYYNQKTRYLKNLAGFLKDHPFRKLKRQSKDAARRSLLDIKGIGPETADCILLYALDKISFVVDAYTIRMFSYLKIIKPDAAYRRVQELFELSLPQNLDIFKEYHALIVRHGKEFYSKKSLGANDHLLTAAK